jgi:hypothetical protein
VDATVEAGVAPDEAGGEDAASLFDASGDARVRVMRRDQTTQKFVTHGFFPPTVKEEDIAMAFGGGNYRAQLVIPDPASGLSKIKRSRDFSIPGAYRPPNRITTMEEVGQNPAPAAVNGGREMMLAPTGGDLASILNAGVVSTLLDLLKTTKEINTRPVAGPDPMLLKLMEIQAASQQQMMQLMLTIATKETGDSKKEVLDLMTKMKELTAPTNGGAPNPANPLDMFNSMLETFKSFREAADDVASPRGGSGDVFMDSIPKLVEVVAEQSRLSKDRAASMPRPAPVPTTQVNTALPPSTDGVPMWRVVLKQQAPRLIQAAQQGQDADVLAGMAVMFAPTAFVPTLREFFHRDHEEVVNQVMEEIPELSLHRDWVNIFVESVQERLFPEEFDEEQTTVETPETPQPES